MDDNNVQVSPPGFHVTFLPFAEDFRNLHYEETPNGGCVLSYEIFTVNQVSVHSYAIWDSSTMPQDELVLMCRHTIFGLSLDLFLEPESTYM